MADNRQSDSTAQVFIQCFWHPDCPSKGFDLLMIDCLLGAGELPITMLACARIGAVHSVVFAGFSAESLASRVEDCKSRVVVTTSGVMRGKKKLETKAIVDDALQISKRDGFEVGPACQTDASKNMLFLDPHHSCSTLVCAHTEMEGLHVNHSA